MSSLNSLLLDFVEVKYCTNSLLNGFITEFDKGDCVKVFLFGLLFDHHH
jgi:hypothetical protein